ncbi:hypothetical protein [Marinobacter xestospongiae]|uniref:hypothetical protein n=1 Tax=Marinobacter xestospongiae TaxID=994319 RepID=UPI0020067385|nr:hypothetical protein [Marinobacter xestospongiae]MCK7565550.1 hypothetical protein [Marinobacter xestospongiae]
MSIFESLKRLAMAVVLVPYLLIYAYVIGPLLVLVLVPGGLALLLLVGRGEAWAVARQTLFRRSAQGAELNRVPASPSER